MDGINRVDLSDIKIKINKRRVPSNFRDTDVRIVRKSLTKIDSDIENIRTHCWESENGIDQRHLKCDCGDKIRIEMDHPYSDANGMLKYLRSQFSKIHQKDVCKISKTRKCTFTEEDWLVKDIIV